MSNQRVTPTAASPAGRLAEVRSWGYQLQDLDIDDASAAPLDLLVIDYALDGSEETALSPADLERLKQRRDGGERLVYAYISVGEAETYRYYWREEWKDAPPSWLLSENPDWPGNHMVAYWDEDWQAILFGGAGCYIDRIAAAGFDGLYLDRCDVHDDIAAREKRVAKARGDLEGDMTAFITRLSAYVRRNHPRLGIIMQNAEHLLEHAEVRHAIDGIAKEELLYGESGGARRNAKATIEENRRNLDRMKRDGKAVLAVEYIDDPTKRQQAIDEIQALGYVAYVSRQNRDLATLETGAAPMA
ncbi:MAG: endo alpha-1,4 polygalactosaminidase [Hyphomicrobiaceae bacterium]|nr:endo alpha-1,4 polygalactosaminidase [Hyphomicrobiaceae bacterium]